MNRVLAFDLGSRRVGLADDAGWSDTIELDPALVAGAARAVALEDVRLVVFELAPGYAPVRESPASTAATARSIMRHRDVMIEFAVRIRVRCEEASIPVREIAAQTWRAALGMGKDRSDPACRAALVAVLGESVVALLRDEHQVDARGALEGVLRQEAEEARRAARAERAGLPPVPRGTRERAPRGPRRDTRREVPARVDGVRCCRRCGGPRKGHVRGLPCPPVPQT